MKKIKAGLKFKFRGKQVRVVEYNGWHGNWWIRALEPVYGYAKGEEFTLTDSTIQKYINEK